MVGNLLRTLHVDGVYKMYQPSNTNEQRILDSIKNMRLECGDGSNATINAENVGGFYYTYDFSTEYGNMKVTGIHYHRRDYYDSFDDFIESITEDFGYDDGEGNKRKHATGVWQYCLVDVESAYLNARENGETPNIFANGTIISLRPMSYMEVFTMIMGINRDIELCVSDVVEQFNDSEEYHRDPLGYYGMKQSDFL